MGDGLFGTRHGSLFEPAGWVDLAKKPGRTPQPPRPWASLLRDTLLLTNLFLSPNLIWLAAAVFVYVVFPYDLEVAREWAFSWVAWRLLVNSALVVAYYEFWYISLYIRGAGKRKYAESWRPTTAQRLHNVYYSLLGVVQWTAIECAFLHCYATGRLPYVSDESVWTSGAKGIGVFLLYTYLIPSWRSFHFYAAHRFLHVPPIYRYVHSLHHRSVDVDVWSGLAMHPVEHLYYYACILPSVYLAASMSPFHMMWNGVHLLLSPAASHSGWEDHTQGDQFHYVHHANFECNYGSASMALDHFFGTFLDRLPEDHAEGQVSNKKEDDSHSSASSFAGFNVKSRPGFNLYMGLSCGLLVGAASAAVIADHESWPRFAVQAAGFSLSFGPLVLAVAMAAVDPAARRNIQKWFQKQSQGARGLATLVFHLAIGTAVTALPMYHLGVAVYGDPTFSVPGNESSL